MTFLVPYNCQIIKSRISRFELVTPFTYTTKGKLVKNSSRILLLATKSTTKIILIVSQRKVYCNQTISESSHARKETAGIHILLTTERRLKLW